MTHNGQQLALSWYQVAVLLYVISHSPPVHRGRTRKQDIVLSNNTTETKYQIHTHDPRPIHQNACCLLLKCTKKCTSYAIVYGLHGQDLIHKNTLRLVIESWAIVWLVMIILRILLQPKQTIMPPYNALCLTNKNKTFKKSFILADIYIGSFLTLANGKTNNSSRQEMQRFVVWRHHMCSVGPL